LGRWIAAATCGLLIAFSTIYGATVAAAAVTYGSIKVSGAVADTYQIQGQCKTFTGTTETFVTLDPYALNSPTLSITAPAGASAKGLPLAHSGTFDVEYETTAGLIWLAGFSGGTSDLGSGTLTMTAGGRSGSLVANLLPYRTSATAPVEVVANWNGASHSTPPPPPKTTVSSPISSCLIGTWRETTETDSITVDNSQVTLTGDIGRVLVFERSGEETVSYAKATPLTGPVNGIVYSIDAHGTITYQDSSHNAVLSFEDGNFSKFSETGTYGTEKLSFARPATSAPVKFSCTSTGLEQSSAGYYASFLRT
jgi:hypothetical protein